MCPWIMGVAQGRSATAAPCGRCDTSTGKAKTPYFPPLHVRARVAAPFNDTLQRTPIRGRRTLRYVGKDRPGHG